MSGQGAALSPGGPRHVRAFAPQYKQDLVFAQSYVTFAAAMDRLLTTYVVPHLHPTAPNLVVLHEVLGLLTALLGSRGLAARAVAVPLELPSRLLASWPRPTGRRSLTMPAAFRPSQLREPCFWPSPM